MQRRATLLKKAAEKDQAVKAEGEVSYGVKGIRTVLMTVLMCSRLGLAAAVVFISQHCDAYCCWRALGLLASPHARTLASCPAFSP